ncbi:hypothetical protein ACTXT7_006232 [Hymenolepis weldensis]
MLRALHKQSVWDEFIALPPQTPQIPLSPKWPFKSHLGRKKKQMNRGGRTNHPINPRSICSELRGHELILEPSNEQPDELIINFNCCGFAIP